jgi:LysM repeat protein
MTDRGLPSSDASPACPFVAFEDERDERADRPDHRHRCYAEVEPAPRALAHQEAYCLSSAFPVCPVFQEWARREAAHTRAGGSAATAPPAMPDRAAAVTVDPDEAGGDAQADGDAARDVPAGRDDLPVEATPRRNPPRDWAAPPPWATGAGGSSGSRGGERQADATGFLAPRVSEGQGLAGSAADRLAGGEAAPESVAPPLGPPTRNVSDHPSAPADPELAGLVGAAGAAGAAGADRAAGPGRSTSEGYPPVARSGRRPAVSSTRDRDRDRDRERERERAAAADRSGHRDGPVWERQRRNEAYPQIKTRVGLPALPRVAVLAIAILVAAVGLFVIGPDLLGIGSGDVVSRPSPSRSAAVATASPRPTPVPAPTPQVYVIKSGDTIRKIASAFGLAPEDLCAANKETVTDCDKIIVGNELIIPVPPQDEVNGGSPSP